MRTRMSLKRSAAVAVLAVVPAGLVGLGAPASAASAQTATLKHGTLVVTGTLGADLVDIAVARSQVTVDFGRDGTIDAHFPLHRVVDISVRQGAGNDVSSVTGTGTVPVAIVSGTGEDQVKVVGHIGRRGTGDAPTSISTQGGKDQVQAVTPGPVTINTGGGPDSVEGGGAAAGAEAVNLGGGDDFFRSSMGSFIGKRSDTVVGGPGTDAIEVDGTWESDRVELAARVGHLIVTHDQRDSIDSVGVENVSYESSNSAESDGRGDTVIVGDLTGTGVQRFTPDFGIDSQHRAPNTSADSLIVTGTSGVDHIRVSGSGQDVLVDGLSTRITPIWLQPTDLLEIDTRGSRDDVDSSGLQQGLVQLVVR